MTGFLNLADMFDGGGAGRAGDTFMGGPLSGLLNSIGIRPMGYAQRHSGGAGGLLSPMGMGMPGSQPAPTAPAAPPVAPITQDPLMGSMTQDQYLAYLRWLLQNQDPYRLGPQ